MKTYRLGVLGLGEGRSVISAALASPHWELAELCDLNETLAHERMQEFHYPHFTKDYNEMLLNPDIDVIGIYTPDPLHGRHIRQALEAGKHVICTKPLLPSLEEAQSLLEVQAHSPGKLMVGQSSRFFEPMRHQRRDFEAGRHGELISVETQYITDARWFLQKAWSLGKGFSWMYNFLIHAVDLARWYLPDIHEVYGVGVVSANSKAYGLEVPDTLHFIFKDAQGRVATVKGSYAQAVLEKVVEPSISCLLRGTNGTSRAEYPRLQYHTHFADEGPKAHDLNDRHDYYFRFENESHHAGEYQNYLEYFAECLDRGETPLPDLNEGLHTLAIMAAMEESMKTGLPVKV